jgi:hypothetical protein
MYDYISIEAKGAATPSLLTASGAKSGDEILSVVQVNIVPGNDMMGVFGKFIPADGYVAYIGSSDLSSYTFLLSLKRKAA